MKAPGAKRLDFLSFIIVTRLDRFLVLVDRNCTVIKRKLKISFQMKGIVQMIIIDFLYAAQSRRHI